MAALWRLGSASLEGRCCGWPCMLPPAGGPAHCAPALARASSHSPLHNPQVIDEADRILEIGFEEEMRQIVKLLPKDRQTMLFSATQTTKVRRLLVSYSTAH